MKFIAFCLVKSGCRNYPAKYKLHLENQTETSMLSKKQNDVRFNIEYINKLFGLDERKKEKKKPEEAKPTLQNIFSQIIPKHLLKKQKKILRTKPSENVVTEQKENTNIIKINEFPKSMTEIINSDENSKFLLIKKSEQEIPKKIKRKFTIKKIKNTTKLYEKETISFSAKAVKKTSLTLIPLQENNENYRKRNSLMIQISNQEEKNFNSISLVKPLEKALIHDAEKKIYPLRSFTIRTKNEAEKSKKDIDSREEIKTFEKELILMKKTSNSKKKQNIIILFFMNKIQNKENIIICENIFFKDFEKKSQKFQRAASIEKTMHLPKVNVSNIFSLQLIPEKMESNKGKACNSSRGKVILHS